MEEMSPLHQSHQHALFIFLKFLQPYSSQCACFFMLAGQAIHNQTPSYNYVLGTYYHCITRSLTYTGLHVLVFSRTSKSHPCI